MSRNKETPKGTLVIDLSTKNMEIISQAAAIEQTDLNEYIVNKLLLSSLRVIYESGNVTSDDIRNIDKIINNTPSQDEDILNNISMYNEIFKELIKPEKDKATKRKPSYGKAARDNLAKGVPIYYTTGGIPKGLIIKEYPSGKKELLDFPSGKEVYIKDYKG
ncbi:DUF1778 domain-containing protein [Escherichia coli]|nr:hypothetical protein [Escherichia coli]EFH9256224.1 DUF1778 domain-containing protein [Escherichia coli]ELM5143517.1 DUF1778 domain-containing protein [Escherichia coli]MBB8802342.1 DUF1778 domain-containing protein [Escherichia coli]HBP8239113.1 DUF1778 domain-containing protein [Escherichia coli]